MTEQQSRRDKIAAANLKIKQLEADIYFLQGYIKALEDEDGLTIDELKDALGAVSVEVNENDNAKTAG